MWRTTPRPTWATTSSTPPSTPDTRLAFSEVLSNEKGPTCAGFFERAQAFFAAHGIGIEAVLTDNAKNYLGKDFTRALGTLEHRRIRPKPTPDEREGGAPQPHPPRRMGLRPDLHLKCSAHPSA